MILSGRPPKALVYLSTTEHMYICTPLAHLDADCLHNANNFVAMYCICTQGATYTVYDGKVKNTQCTCRELPMLVIETRVNMTPTIRRALLKTKHFPLVFTDHSTPSHSHRFVQFHNSHNVALITAAFLTPRQSGPVPPQCFERYLSSRL